MSHTPGPWKWNLSNALVQDNADGWNHVLQADPWKQPSAHDLELIAAAPELLALLRETWVHNVAEQGHRDAATVRALDGRIDALLQKLEGV